MIFGWPCLKHLTFDHGGMRSLAAKGTDIRSFLIDLDCVGAGLTSNPKNEGMPGNVRRADRRMTDSFPTLLQLDLHIDA